MKHPISYNQNHLYATTYTNAKAFKWWTRFLELAKTTASWSEDTSTKVGAVAVGPDNEVRSMGYNGFCRGVKPRPELFERPLKYEYFEHAERNCVFHAARMGTSLLGCTMITTCFPCMDCARSIIQSGIGILVSPEPDFNHERWGAQFGRALNMLSEANVFVVFIEENNQCPVV